MSTSPARVRRTAAFPGTAPVAATLALAGLIGLIGLASVAAPGDALAELAPDGDTLGLVERRGTLLCGMNTDLPGFGQTDSLGRWRGFNVDLCRAVSAAVFGEADRVEYVPVTSTDRFTGLLEGRYDLLTRSSTWTLERNALYGEFVGVSYYDGQGFMVRRSSGIRSALELDGRPICITRASTTETTTAGYFETVGMRYRPEFFDDEQAAGEAYGRGECDAVTSDRSILAAIRTSIESPRAHVLLPEVVSKEPLGPLVRPNEHRWTQVVRWSLNCLISAEEIGIGSDTVDDPGVASTPQARRLLGVEGDTGRVLGLAPDWCDAIVRQVGNYREVFERNLGEGSALDLPRGPNQLVTNGGWLYSPPF